jgi:hypothetical protein
MQMSPEQELIPRKSVNLDSIQALRDDSCTALLAARTHMNLGHCASRLRAKAGDKRRSGRNPALGEYIAETGKSLISICK